ncbi:MAG: dihydrofolate reductase [Methylococcales bacterium]|jgi:dihydrofolate reductase|nr:dihydrofolate reductase [Methylococcales bacterium]MBT7444057.1 dihydrofolate reductase [Methylococcales bacterium]
MPISMIVAMSDARVIGYKNELPWRLSADLQYFRQVTMGKPIVMGRKTFESIGRCLPGRDNYIITRDENYTVEGGKVFQSLNLALEDASVQGEVMIIGGAQIYEVALPLVDQLYVTEVSGTFEGDAFFPEIATKEWGLQEMACFSADEKNEYDYCFKRYTRLVSC